MSELKKLNVDGAVAKTPDEPPKSTYKSIPETDTEFKAKINSNMVRENGDNCQDGAGEKMLMDNEKVPKVDPTVVKFIAEDQKNGDAKIDILEIKAFSGLTKEELMKYCNDPFWVRLRWCMFIGFWLLWIGMLAGAVIIIVGAPKCALPPPKTWWEQGPILDLDSPDSTDGSPPYLSLDLANLRSLGLKGLMVPQPADIQDAYEVIHNEPPPDVSAFSNFAAKAKENNIKLIVELTPNFVSQSSEWFKMSEAGNGSYADYFVWLSSDKTPPNNWNSMEDGSAWSKSDVRNMFYLHQIGKTTADLNFRNDEVVKEFDKVLKFWINNGASGFRLSKVKHLLVDKNFIDEAVSKKLDRTHEQYDFYSHTRTSYQEGLADILAHWRQVVLDNTDGEGLLTLTEDLESTEVLKMNHTGPVVVDLPRASRALVAPAPDAPPQSAKALSLSLQNAFTLIGDKAWMSWEYSTPDGKHSSELSIISMLLPGAPIVKMDQIVSSEDNSTKASDTYTSLLGLRAMPSMLHGDYSSHLLANDTVFVFTRLKSGNPGCIVVYNPSDTTTTVDLKSVEGIPAELTVVLLSSNYKEKDVITKTKLPSGSVTVSSKSVIVLTYVPDKKE